jgi:hypothetical protein
MKVAHASHMAEHADNLHADILPVLPPDLAPVSPLTEEHQVIDYDFGFVTGVVQGFTLWPERGDTLMDFDTYVRLTLHDEDGRVEVIDVHKHALAWNSCRERTFTVLIEEPVIQSPDVVARQNLEDLPRTESAWPQGRQR